jgi:hypothetical protein
VTADPDLHDHLPTLDQWGDRLRDAAEREEQSSARRRLPIRRMAVAAAVMLVAVPGAVATRSIWVDPIDRVDPIRDPNSTPAILLAQGRSGSVRWRVGGFERTDGRRCVQFQMQMLGTQHGLAGACSPVSPDRAQIIPATGSMDDVAFVYGTVGPDVVEVAVTVAGGGTRRVATQAPDPDALRRSGMPDVRVFVAAFPGGLDALHPPLVVARDAGGQVLGMVGGTAP